MGQSSSSFFPTSDGSSSSAAAVQRSHLLAWAEPTVATKFAGATVAPLVTKALTSLPASQPTVTLDQLSAVLTSGGLSSAQLSALQSSFVASGPAGLAALSAILRQHPSAEDLLLTVEMLVDDAAGEPEGDGSLAGVPAATLGQLVEQLDAAVSEQRTPGGEDRKITPAELQGAFARTATLALVMWPALAKRIAQGIQEQGLDDDAEEEPTPAAAAAASSAGPASASAAAPKKKKPAGASAASSSSSSSGFGGLDLSISGTSIKAPKTGFTTAK